MRISRQDPPRPTPTSFRLGKEARERLARLAEREDASRTWVIERALELMESQDGADQS